MNTRGTTPLLLLSLFAFIFCSCSKPESKIIPLDKKKWDNELFPFMERLSESEKAFLKGYLNRMAPGGLSGRNNIPPGTTIGEAIADQRRHDGEKYLLFRSEVGADADAKRILTWEEIEADAEVQKLDDQEKIQHLHQWYDLLKMNAQFSGQWDDPQYRKKYQKQVTAIEKAIISGKMLSSPTPGAISPTKPEAQGINSN